MQHLIMDANQKGSVLSSSWVEIDGNQYQKKLVNLYESEEFDYALGTCTIYYDHCGSIVGMKDDYDFNMSGASRELIDHVATYFGSFIPGTSFSIRYGIYD